MYAQQVEVINSVNDVKTNVLMSLDISDHGLIVPSNKSTLGKTAWVEWLVKIWKSKSKKENLSKTFQHLIYFYLSLNFLWD